MQAEEAKRHPTAEGDRPPLKILAIAELGKSMLMELAKRNP